MQLKPEELDSRLGKGLPPVIVISGDEPLLVADCVEQVRKAAIAQGFDEREVLNAEANFDWGRLAASRDALSLFASRRVLELRLPSGKPGDQGGKAFTEYAARPADDTVLLLVTGRLDKTAQSTRWFKALDAAGLVVIVYPMEVRRLPAWIAARLRRVGLSADDEALNWLAERTEGNLLAAAQAVDHLALLHDGGRLELDDIRHVVGESARYNVFDLVDAALEGEHGRVVRMLEGLRIEGAEPVLVLWALHRDIRALAQLTQARGQGRSLDGAFNQLRIWGRRQPVFRKALGRVGQGAGSLLRDVAFADRVIKGLEPDDTWETLTRLALRLAGLAAIGRPSAGA